MFNHCIKLMFGSVGKHSYMTGHYIKPRIHYFTNLMLDIMNNGETYILRQRAELCTVGFPVGCERRLL